MGRDKLVVIYTIRIYETRRRRNSRSIGRHILNYHAIGSDTAVIADCDITYNFSTGTDIDIIPYSRRARTGMAFQSIRAYSDMLEDHNITAYLAHIGDKHAMHVVGKYRNSLYLGRLTNIASVSFLVIEIHPPFQSFLHDTGTLLLSIMPESSVPTLNNNNTYTTYVAS